jgi:hypothetical protein
LEIDVTVDVTRNTYKRAVSNGQEDDAAYHQN